MLRHSIRFRLNEILLSMSDAIDMISPQLNRHHQKVAYLSYRIASEIGLSLEQQRLVLMQGLVHDIGALSVDERLSLIEEEQPDDVNSHAFRGARLLSKCRPLKALADGIRYHHLRWDYGRGMEFLGRPIPINSHILHLADRVSVYFDDAPNVITKSSKLMEHFSKGENTRYSPMLLEALAELAKREYIWLEMSDREPIQYLPDYVMEFGKHDLDDFLQMARMFSRVIDFRSRFTATHSAGVAHTAGKLAELSGMSADERKMMLIAGYLHDLGKLAVKNSILEKPSKLSINEFDVIRSHSFYTYKLLSGIEGFHTINQWASFHHEKLNGAGYPFHLKGEQIPFGSRVMTVADIFTAVIEHRPYRNGVDKQQVRGIFEKLVKNGEVCEAAVDTLVGNLDVFVELCNREQQLAAEDYESFFSDEETAVLV